MYPKWNFTKVLGSKHAHLKAHIPTPFRFHTLIQAVAGTRTRVFYMRSFQGLPPFDIRNGRGEASACHVIVTNWLHERLDPIAAIREERESERERRERGRGERERERERERRERERKRHAGNI